MKTLSLLVILLRTDPQVHSDSLPNTSITYRLVLWQTSLRSAQLRKSIRL